MQRTETGGLLRSHRSGEPVAPGAARADTVEKVVDHFVHRFLSLPLAAKERGLLVDFLRGKLGSSAVKPGDKIEESLRELLYLVLSTPEYQLG